MLNIRIYQGRDIKRSESDNFSSAIQFFIRLLKYLLLPAREWDSSFEYRKIVFENESENILNLELENEQASWNCIKLFVIL